MPEPEIGSVPFKEALEHFRKKVPVETDAWDEMLAEEHAKAFTVAGSTKADVVEDIFESIKRIQNEGGTLADFRKDFDKIVADKGWSYNGKRGWRTRIIFDTNLRTSQAAGRWEQIMRRQRALQKRRPNETLYLIYSTVGDLRVREAHRDWHHTVLPVDDPFWNTHYPPNGWSCRCIVRTASNRTLKREGFKVSKAPEVSFEDRFNKRSGQIYPGQTPGIDTGWNYNVGKAHLLGPQEALGQRVMLMDPSIAAAVLDDTNGIVKSLNTGFVKWAGKLLDGSRLRQGERRGVGYISLATIQALRELPKAKLPSTALITIEDTTVRHMQRPSKRPTKAGDRRTLADDDILNLVVNLANSDAVLYQVDNGALLYIFNPVSKAEKRKGKYAVNVQYGLGKSTLSEVRTGGLEEVHQLRDEKRYKLLEGEL